MIKCTGSKKTDIEIRSIFPQLDVDSNLIFHGKNITGTIPRDLTDGIQVGPSLSNEFGAGVYCTPDLKEALSHLCYDENGCLSGFVYEFDWEHHDQTKIRYLRDDSWKALVRGYVAGEDCQVAPPVAYDWKHDFWVYTSRKTRLPHLEKYIKTIYSCRQFCRRYCTYGTIK